MRKNYSRLGAALKWSPKQMLSGALLTAMVLLSSIGISQTITVGTGTDFNSTTSYPTAYGNYWWGARSQFLYRVADLQAAGATAGLINNLAFNVTAINSGVPLEDYVIYIKNTTTNDLTSAWETGLTQVYGPIDYTPATGWNQHAFTTPFFWDGVSNIVVEVCFNNTAYTDNESVEQTIGLPAGSSRTYRADIAGVCGNTNVSTSQNETSRPNIQFNFLPPFANDAGVSSAESPKPFECTTSNVFAIKLMNGGSDTLTSATVNWSVNGTAQAPFLWSGSIDPYAIGDSTFVGNFTFTPGDIIEVYTTMPNNVPDSAAFNDTLTYVVPQPAMSGIYTVDPAGTGSNNFLSVGDAGIALSTRGVCGSVIVNIADGVYTDSLILDNVQGTSSTNLVVFQSTSVDSSLVTIENAPTTAGLGTVTIENTTHIVLKNISIVNPNSSGDAVALWGKGQIDGLVVERVHLKNNVTSSSSFFDEQAVAYKDGTKTTGITFNECTFENGTEGLYWDGSNNNYDKGTHVTNCTFLNQEDAGLYLYYQENPIITGNTVSSNNSSGFANGMQLYYFNGDNVTVTNNTILQDGSNWPEYGIYMFNVNGELGNHADVSGNVVSMQNEGENAIYMSGSIFVDLSNNSLFMNSASSFAATLEVLNGAANVSQNNAVQAAGAATALNVSGAPFTVSNHNAFASEANIASWQGTHTSLADMQQATGTDLNSVELMGFMFNDTLSLRTCNDTLDGAGTQPSYFMEDLQGDPVNPNGTDIGADQFATANSFDHSSPVGICPGGNASLEAWYFDTIVWNNTDTGNVYQTNIPGNVVVKGMGLCGTAYDTILVQPAVSVDLPTSSVVCVGGTTTINAGITNASYVWSTGETTQSISVITPGAYTVTVTDQDGCISDDQTDVEFNVPVDLGEEEIMCGGQAITLDAGISGGTYNWSTGDNSQTTSVSSPGVVNVTVTDANGCVSSDDVDVVDVPFPVADFTSYSSNYSAAFTNVSTGGTSFVWNFGDGSTSTDESPTHIYDWTNDSAVTYTVTLVVTNACGVDSTKNDVIVGSAVGFEELASGAVYSVYPNPVKSVLNIKVDQANSSEFSFELMDVQGKVVAQRNAGEINGLFIEQVDVAKLSTGIYLLKVQVGNDVAVSQVVVK
jgi:parallel beta-helix repeat protein